MSQADLTRPKYADWGTSNKIAFKAKKMHEAGSSVADVARHFGVSAPTAARAIKKAMERQQKRSLLAPWPAGVALTKPAAVDDILSHIPTAQDATSGEYVAKLEKGTIFFTSEALSKAGVPMKHAVGVIRFLETHGLATLYVLTKT
jgi:transposase